MTRAGPTVVSSGIWSMVSASSMKWQRCVHVGAGVDAHAHLRDGADVAFLPIVHAVDFIRRVAGPMNHAVMQGYAYVYPVGHTAMLADLVAWGLEFGELGYFGRAESATRGAKDRRNPPVRSSSEVSRGGRCPGSCFLAMSAMYRRTVRQSFLGTRSYRSSLRNLPGVLK